MRNLLIFLTLITGLNAKRIIVTSISPLRLIVNDLVDTTEFKVISIVPKGQNPHTFDPRPSDIKKLKNACAFIYVADIPEPWAKRLVKNLPESSRPRVFKVWALLGKEESIKMNPHFWFNPYEVKKLALGLGDSLKTCGHVSPDKFISRLDSLVSWINNQSKNLKKKCFIPSHNSWTVFAKAFGITTTDVLWTTEGTELSPKKIIKIMKEAKKCGTDVLVLDAIYNPALVTPFKENGFKIVTLDPQGWDEFSYIEFMKKNLKKLFEALNDSN